MPYSIIILDIETTINAPQPHFGASPAHPDNRSVMIGYIADNYPLTHTSDPNELLIDEDTLLVGHNLSFDLHYLMREMDNFPSRCSIWDTQKFEYLWTGRSIVSPSLENTCERLDVPFEKDTEIKERFKVGIGSDKIDPTLLRNYLYEDVRATQTLFQDQLAFLQGDPYKTQYFEHMMDGIFATTKMAHNGLPFDVAGAKQEVDSLQARYEHLSDYVTGTYSAFWPEILGSLNIMSASQVTALLWGREVRYKTDVPLTDELGEPVLFKGGVKKGQQKTRKEERYYDVEPLCEDQIVKQFIQKEWEQTAGAQTINRILSLPGDSNAHAFCKDLLEIRNLSKTINTYFKPYIDFAVKGRIHPSYNHCITQTGRLSSSKPNMQNISGKSQ